MLAHDSFNFFAKRVMMVRSPIGVKKKKIVFFQHFPSPLGISVMLADIIIFLIESDLHAAL